MKQLTYTKEHRLDQLTDELIAAIPSLAPVLIPNDPDHAMQSVMTVQSTGTQITVTVPDETVDAEVDAVVDAHNPMPFLVYAGVEQTDSRLRTTDDLAHEAFRFPTQAKRVYRLTMRVTGIDAGNGVTRDTEARAVFKRPAGTVNQVGTTAVLSNFQDAAASTWAILPSVDGTDMVISVKGAAGRTIDWLMVGEIGSYAPEGAV